MSKTLTRIVAILVLVACALPTVYAKSESKTWRGYLIDKKCGTSVKADSQPLQAIRLHRLECALKADCTSSGFVLYSNAEWFDLDKRGNELATKILKASKRMNGCFVEVSGSVTGQVFHEVEVGANGTVQITGTHQSQVLKTTRIKEIADPQAKWSI